MEGLDLEPVPLPISFWDEMCESGRLVTVRKQDLGMGRDGQMAEMMMRRFCEWVGLVRGALCVSELG